MNVDQPTPELAALQERISTNRYDYDAHLQLISFLRARNDFDSLQTARQAMADIFPLSAELWKEWIADETMIASSADEKRALVQLYLKAVQDYQSVDLWVLFLSFIIEEYKIGIDEGDEWLDLEQLQSYCKQGLRALERHFALGNHIWNLYKNFLVDILDWKDAAQVQKVRLMFHERLAVPHLRNIWFTYRAERHIYRLFHV